MAASVAHRIDCMAMAMAMAIAMRMAAANGR
jgi:hypothetical protein